MKKSFFSLLFFILFTFHSNAQLAVWAKAFDGDYSRAEKMTKDPSGNIASTGIYNGVVDFDPGPGTFTLQSLNNAIFITKLDANGNLLWAKSIDCSSGNIDVKGICSDASGNIYLTGSFSFIIDADPSASSLNLFSTGSSDVYLIKLDPSGALVWANKIGGANYDIASAMVFSQGDICLLGYANGIVDFDLSASTNTLNISGNFLAKYTTAGNLVFVKKFDGGNSNVNLHASSSGQIFITGSEGITDYDPSSAIYTLPSSGGVSDAFVLKLSSSGNFIWVKSFGGSTVYDYAYGTAITTDNSGNVYTTGVFSLTIDFNPGPSVYTLTSQGFANYDIFVTKLDMNGNFQWAKLITGPYYENAYAITCDDQNVLVAGTFSANVDFDPGTSTDIRNATASDAFVTSINVNGNYFDTYVVNGIGNDMAYDVLIYGTNEMCAIGEFSGSNVDFDPGMNVLPMTTSVFVDAFVVRWKKQANGLKTYSDKNAISIYPVPFNKNICIKTSYEIDEAKLYNISGIEVPTHYKKGDDMLILEEEISKGLYFLRMKTTDGNEFTNKLYNE